MLHIAWCSLFDLDNPLQSKGGCPSSFTSWQFIHDVVSALWCCSTLFVGLHFWVTVWSTGTLTVTWLVISECQNENVQCWFCTIPVMIVCPTILFHHFPGWSHEWSKWSCISLSPGACGAEVCQNIIRCYEKLGTLHLQPSFMLHQAAFDTEQQLWKSWWSLTNHFIVRWWCKFIVSDWDWFLRQFGDKVFDTLIKFLLLVDKCMVWTKMFFRTLFECCWALPIQTLFQGVALNLTSLAAINTHQLLTAIQNSVSVQQFKVLDTMPIESFQDMSCWTMSTRTMILWQNTEFVNHSTWHIKFGLDFGDDAVDWRSKNFGQQHGFIFCL